VTYVVDASAVIALLLRRDSGERIHRRLGDDTDATLVSVAQLDAEVLSDPARLHRAQVLASDEVEELLLQLARLERASRSDRRSVVGRCVADAGRHRRAGRAVRRGRRELGTAPLTTDERLAGVVPDLAVGPGR
jgi:uncharacterized protein with PIN domain